MFIKYGYCFSEPATVTKNTVVCDSHDTKLMYDYESSPWVQFQVLVYRMMLQQMRDIVSAHLYYVNRI